MNRKMLFKLAVDLAMTILMLIEMAYYITGNTVHEFLGVIVFVLFIVHIFLNRRWFGTILKGKHNMRRILQIVLNLLFLAAMAVMIICGILISSDLFSFIQVNDDMIFRQIHVQTAYWGFIIMAVHVGFSWGIIINSVRRMTGIVSTSLIRTIGLRVLAALIVFYGVYASFEREIGFKLTVYNPFGTWVNDDTAIKFIIDHLSIMGIYICGTHYALKFIQREGQTATQK
ncbi:DUF4405 domain-containing protein [Paenibacillus prosopidis]|uniref:Uncharacterized protein DUF4405 n=1 Tax=Paenibacillus prosopidis TaxID=630520 RepID=A0A368VIP1_9BACL|nr:DUF4405 domain-containing protein [Paenibacillus prosopidis]RCW41127.1 uncharacterized protein DUF4405 [Paenibacillus prosopidis]